MKMKMLNLEDAYNYGMEKGKGFVIDDTNSIVKEERNERGIYSPLFGSNEDYFQRYKCNCGELVGKFYEGETCKTCGHIVKREELDLSRTGWFVLDKYYLIHPIMYLHLVKLITPKKLNNILKGERTIDVEGKIVNPDPTDENNPFHNIGMIEFKERFDEVLEYFKNRNKETYNFIKERKDLVFTRHIPVFHLALRDLTIIQKSVIQEPINKKYNSLLGSINALNRNRRSTKTELKILPDLYEAQKKLNDLSDDIIKLIGGKSGHIRSSVLGTRINFSARNVIVPMIREHEINEIELPYLCMLELYKNELIYLLKTMDNIPYVDALNRWELACEKYDKKFYLLMKHLIENKEGGLYVLVNREVIAAFNSNINRKSL